MRSCDQHAFCTGQTPKTIHCVTSRPFLQVPFLIKRCSLCKTKPEHAGKLLHGVCTKCNVHDISGGFDSYFAKITMTDWNDINNMHTFVLLNKAGESLIGRAADVKSKIDAGILTEDGIVRELKMKPYQFRVNVFKRSDEVSTFIFDPFIKMPLDAPQVKASGTYRKMMEGDDSD